MSERSAETDTVGVAPPRQYDRQLALAPFRRHLGLDGAGDGEPPSVIEINGNSMTLDAWERKHLAAARAEDVENPVVESLAFLAKQVAQESLITRFAEFSDSGDQFGSLIDELITDTAVGLAIQEDLQRAIDQVVGSGRIDEAKRQSSLRSRIRKQIKRLTACIGGDGQRQAELQAQEMVVGPMRTLARSRLDTARDSTGEAAASTVSPTGTDSPPGPADPASEQAAAVADEPHESVAVAEVAAGPPPEFHERLAALSPYRHYLGLDDPGPLEIPESLDIDGQPLALESWERRIMADVGSETESDVPGADLVLEALTYLAKQIAGPCEVDVGSADGEQVLDLAVGLAILEELQREIDTRIRSGRMEDAKQFSGLRNRISQHVAAIRDCVSDDLFHIATERSALMVATVVPNSSSGSGPSLSGTVVDTPWTRKRAAARAQAARSAEQAAEPEVEEGASRLTRLSILLAVSLLAWGIFILPRYTQPRMTVLTQADFGSIDGIETILARPPSLFAVVNPQRWNQMSSAERLVVIERLGSVAGQHGYSGAHITDRDGTAVGKWFQQDGARVIEPATRR